MNQQALSDSQISYGKASLKGLNRPEITAPSHHAFRERIVKREIYPRNVLFYTLERQEVAHQDNIFSYQEDEVASFG